MKVSVIIPTFNRPGYLAQAVDSVLQQTDPVFEIILVNDGSSPIHRDKIEALTQWDERIRVYHFPENKGVSAARNFGLEKSRGDYILFLDDDDLLHPQMVESNLKFFADHPEIDVVSSGYDIFFDSTPPDSDWRREQRQAISPAPILYSWDYGDTSLLETKPFSALLRKSIRISSSLARKEAIGPTRFPVDLTRGEDTFFWLTIANRGCRFRFNQAQHGLYRLHCYNSLSSPDWWRESLEYHLKIFREGMVVTSLDRFLLHLAIARLTLQFDRTLCFKHTFHACCILLSFPMIRYWPLLFKSIPAKFYSRWRLRKVHKALGSIVAREIYGNRQ